MHTGWIKTNGECLCVCLTRWSHDDSLAFSQPRSMYTIGIGKEHDQWHMHIHALQNTLYFVSQEGIGSNNEIRAEAFKGGLKLSSDQRSEECMGQQGPAWRVTQLKLRGP